MTTDSDLTPPPLQLLTLTALAVCASGNLRADRRQGGALSLDDTTPLSPLMKPLFEEIPVFGITLPEQTVCVCVCVSDNAEVGRNNFCLKTLNTASIYPFCHFDYCWRQIKNK